MHEEKCRQKSHVRAHSVEEPALPRGLARLRATLWPACCGIISASFTFPSPVAES